MSIFSHCVSSKGQPIFPFKGTGNPEANRHQPTPLPLQNVHYKKEFGGGSSSKRSIPAIKADEERASVLRPAEFEALFLGPPLLQMEKEESKPIQESMAAILAVSVSSAVELDERQVDLIARKMKKITGFTNLRMEKTIDPSLIAGFVISYGDDGSQIIDLSVKGQLANLAARVESTDQWNASHGGST
ncbi:ATP synthase delta chain, chloroplastic [Apostasia shenzhenica]|uniref:ATP synthase delta chain, chloroplastic n=1 Tax=Apostasia shenzhenica TaxID=1088818 RepID=A0A2I0AI15_9ASPA|nr:ATP synthase delta chain, chloroplastic [Apostasia shenzhenica]